MLAGGAIGLIVAIFAMVLDMLTEDDTPRIAEAPSIDANDPFWSTPPIPEAEWAEDTEGVSADADAYLYGKSNAE